MKVSHLFGSHAQPLGGLGKRLIERAEGNPFYLDELLNYLHDQGVSFQDPRALEQLALPTSLHSLILSRVDRLTESQKTTLKVASVIGRVFPAAAIWGATSQADAKQVGADLERLCEVDLTVLDRPEPELVYIFKHVVTQEVTYESLPHATRSKLHNQIGLCLEQLYANRLEQHIDLLAFHFDRSPNVDKKKHYLQKAGEAAQGQYANAAAISYFERLLPLALENEKVEILLKLGKVRELAGDWKGAGVCQQQAFETAERLGDRQAQARCQAATGDLLRKQGLLNEARDWLNLARSHFEEIGDKIGVGQTLQASGNVAVMQGDYPKATSLYQESLALRRELGDKALIAGLLNNLGIIARYTVNFSEARELTEQSLQFRREVGDRWAIANSLNNLGMILRDMNQGAEARSRLEEALTLNRQVGDPWATANTLTSLAEVALDQQDWPAAHRFLEESLKMNLELGDRTAVAFILECFAAIAAAQSKLAMALHLVGAASALRTQVGSPLAPAEQSRLDNYLEPARQNVSPETQLALFNHGTTMRVEEAIALALGKSPDPMPQKV
jgi:predicted ATPase